MTTDDDVLEGVPTSAADNFYLDWGQETARQTIPRLTDSLQRVVTLATAMLGGTLFFVSADVVPTWFRGGAMLLFLAATLAGFYGTLARTEGVRVNDPADIRRFKEEVADFRTRWLWNAAGLFWLGMFVACLGTLLKFACLA